MVKRLLLFILLLISASSWAQFNRLLISPIGTEKYFLPDTLGVAINNNTWTENFSGSPIVVSLVMNGNVITSRQIYFSSAVGSTLVKIPLEGFPIASNCKVRLLSNTTVVDESDNFFEITNDFTNSVKITQVLIPGILTETQLNTLSLGQRIQSIAYADKMGMPKQSIAVQASPSYKDIVSLHEYDNLNRESIKFLSFTSIEGNGNFKYDLLKPSSTNIPYVGSLHYNFYNNPSSAIPVDTEPYQQSVFEKSPLSRPLKTGRVGSLFQPKVNNPNDEHVLVSSYRSNIISDGVLKWTVTDNGISSFTLNSIAYPANSLKVTIAFDGDRLESRIYRDADGKTVMTEKLNYQTWAKTYYVYDAYSNLCAVLTPELSYSLQGSPTTLNTSANGLLTRYAYLYAYDNQNRRIAEKAPGNDWTYHVYDKYDRLVLSQNPNQRTSNEWSFTKYDYWNRPVLSGTTIIAGTLQSVSQTVATQTMMYESTGGGIHGYTNNAYPNVANQNNYLNITYYDDYGFKSLIGGTSYNYNNSELAGLPASESSLTKGQATGSKNQVLGQNTWLWSVSYFDNDGRTVQLANSNHKGGIDRISYTYDFSGKMLSNKFSQSWGSQSFSVKEDFEYDHAGRLLRKFHQIGNDPAKRVLLYSLVYNELGQVITKQIHSANNGSSYLQTVQMKTDIEGKLISQKSEDFELTLGYEINLHGGYQVQPRYNGDITSVAWMNNLKYTAPASNKQYSWSFTYDFVNQLSESRFYERDQNTSSWNASFKNSEYGLTYDLNGNTKTLARRNSLDQEVDNLEFDYGDINQKGNILLSVKDNTTNTEGFKDGNASGQDYFYDGFGNLTKDLNKGITLITYNKLNLTEKIQMSSGSYLKYTYDADGTKLYEELYSTTGSLLKRIDYVGPFVYQNDVVQFIMHEEGRALPIDATNWEYQYILRDHIGSSRMMLSAAPRFKEYKATMESENASVEETNFINLPGTRLTYPLANSTSGGNEVARLNYTSPIGSAISLQVMPGDAIAASAYAYHEGAGYGGGRDLNSIVTAVAGAFGGVAGAAGEAGKIFSSVESAIVYHGMIGTASNNQPAAYLNYLVFDMDMVPVTGGYKRVGTTPGTVQMDPILIDKPGYIFLYLSNTSGNGTPPVYFDDFTVQHQESKLAGFYLNYPLGVEVASQTFERHRMPENTYRYQGKQLQKELGLDYYFFEARLYDPFLGRWFAVDPMGQFASPYNAMGNSPMMGVDPDGRFWHIVIGAAVGGVFNLGSKILSGQVNLSQGWGNAIRDGAVAFGIGAVAGAVGAATGGAFFAAAGGGALGAGGFAAGAIGALGGAAYSVPIQSIGNSAYFQDPQLTFKEYGLSLGISAFTGGSINGITASANGLGFFRGKPHFIPSTTNGTVPDLSKINLTNDPEITLSSTPANARVNQPSSVAKDILEDLPTTRPNGVRLNLQGDGLTSKLRSFTEDNFRTNLIRLTGGIDPGPNFPAHHIIPKQFAPQAARAGINVNNPANGIFLDKATHIRIHSNGYNPEWELFFNEARKADEIFRFAQQMMIRYGIN